MIIFTVGCVGCVECVECVGCVGCVGSNLSYSYGDEYRYYGLIVFTESHNEGQTHFMVPIHIKIHMVNIKKYLDIDDDNKYNDFGFVLKNI
jgi:hypothetical protein